MLILLLLGAPSFAAQVVRVNIDGVIHPITVEVVNDAIRQAEQANAALILIRLDTPGGLMDATREVIQRLVASPVPVAAWVGPAGARAASAGFFLLLAGDAAAMAPGTRTGASSPVTLSGQPIEDTMRRKIESDASAWIRSLAERRGRNAKLAQLTVTEAKSFTAQEALEANLIDLISESEADLLRQLNGREVTLFNGQRRTLSLPTVEVVEYQLTLRQKLMQSLSNPNLAFILMIVGAIGLYVEFSSPGLILPGVLGAILLLLGLGSLSVLPINWVGVALLIVALGMLVAEAFVTSHGILGIGGAIALVLGAVLLVEGPPELRISLATAVGVALPFGLIAVFLTSLVVRAHKQRTSTGLSGLVGTTAVTRTPLDPAGKVFVHGEYWDATSTVPVPEGARVVVLAVEGLRLRVEPLP